MKNIYVLSGLGADERIFCKINFGTHHVTFINWVLPLTNETIEAYALRLSKKIISPNPIIIGLSFGGMMAIEVAKHISTEKIIIISSAKNKYEIPFYYRWAGKLKLHKIIPIKWLINSNLITNRFFSTRTDEVKQIVSSMLLETNIDLLKWSIDKIVTLQNTFVHPNLIHIHGNADNILPIRFVKPNVVIKGGTHLMILSMAKMVEDEIKLQLDDINKNA